jgi:WD40 repeat-containing protein SMU1
VEVWDFMTGKINKDLQFQADDQFMLHDTAVLCLNFSKDSELLVSGSQDGKIKVWQLKTGKCFRKLEAHTKAVTCVAFTRDAAKILSGSYDQTLRLHGLVSGKTLKIFRGHTGTINEAVFNHDGSFVHSASSDGTVKVWDVKSGDCHGSFKPIQGSAAEVTVNTICWLPRGAAEQLLVCNRSATIYLTNLRGEIVRTYQSGKEKLGMFLYAIASPRGDFVYGVAEDSHVYCFRSETAELVHTVKVSEKEVIGLSHHPHKNLLASWADDGTIQLWKP